MTSDWARFRELACCDDRETRVTALSLVRGKPFADVDWPWSTVEGLAATMEAEVCDLASAIGEQALLDGDASLAAHAAEQGILASPYDERLYRLLIRRVRRPRQPRRHPIGHGTACGRSRGGRRTARICAPRDTSALRGAHAPPASRSATGRDGVPAFQRFERAVSPWRSRRRQTRRHDRPRRPQAPFRSPPLGEPWPARVQRSGNEHPWHVGRRPELPMPKL